MCFSAKASFIASSLLALIGSFSLKKVKDKSQILFAFIPILFSIQQFSEGLIWVFKNRLPENSYLIKFLSYIFLTFALIIWPIFIPLALLKLEKNLNVKKYLKIILSLGICWSLFFIFIISKEKLIVNLNCSSIYYKIELPYYINYDLLLIFYTLLTIAPFFISKQKVLKIFGLLLSFSCLISYIYWYSFLTSVWCFFAALLSLSVYLIIRWQNLREEYLKVLDKYL